MSSRSNSHRFSWRHSIRARLAVWYGGVLGVAVVFMSVLFYYYLFQNLYSDFDLSLRTTAETLSRSSLSMNSPFSGLDPDTLLEGMDNPEFFSKFFQFFDPFGNPRLRSRNMPKPEFPLTQKAWNNALQGEMTFETFSSGNQGSVRVLTYPVMRNGDLVRVLRVGGSLLHIEKVLRQLRLLLFFATPAFLILALSGGWFLTHQVLDPVDMMARVARQITAGDLSRRIPVHESRDELSRLAQTFNTMIGRIEDSIERQRQFTANASHAMRTPLTILKGETEMALRKTLTAREYQQILASGLEEINRISKIVEELFILSKADLGENRLEMNPVRLNSLLAETVSQMAILAESKKLALSLDHNDPSIITGDRDRLRELLLNLIENSIQYTPPGGKIVVSLSRAEKKAVITVSDTGIGIPEGDLPKIFDRFYRSSDAQAVNPKGSGLGLAICQWIVISHGGQIDAESRFGEGTTFTVRLPLLSD
jgi:heavy metal sensor kinase